MTDYVVTRFGVVIPYGEWLLYRTRASHEEDSSYASFLYGTQSRHDGDSLYGVSLHRTDLLYGGLPYGGLGPAGDSLSRVLECGKRRLAQAFASNLAKIRLGKLAQANSRSEGVRYLGKLLVENHVALNQKARLLAYELRMMPPMGLARKMKQACDRVLRLSTEHFEGEFLQIVIADHKKSLKALLRAEFSYYRPLVTETILALQKQLAIAQFLGEWTCKGQTQH
jgi:predicted outer membrane protein